ncbi:hypothetical protein [Euzebya rosea]|uniref:hypothetical protein n=1 Tax=Euzebya rosea TaxID=2052804 RepID=UPI001300699A|nr:hypothetical protein [Euzebya rosea]
MSDTVLAPLGWLLMFVVGLLLLLAPGWSAPSDSQLPDGAVVDSVVQIPVRGTAGR